jgi:hypothetical protein
MFQQLVARALEAHTDRLLAALAVFGRPVSGNELRSPDIDPDAALSRGNRGRRRQRYTSIHDRLI